MGGQCIKASQVDLRVKGTAYFNSIDENIN